MLLAAGALASYRVLRPSTSEIIAVAPSGWLWGETTDNRGFEESLAERISIEFANQRIARVVGWPIMMRYRTGGQEFRQIATGVGATKMLLIRSASSGVAVFLLDGVSGQKMWVNEYPAQNNQVDLARTIVKDFVAKQKGASEPR